MSGKMGGQDTPKFFSARTLAVRRISDQVLCLTLCGPEDFVWTPGQHVAVSETSDGRSMSYYSIASAPLIEEPGQFDLAVSEDALRVGALLVPGRQVWISSARGGVPAEILSAERLVLIAMGTGIAPLRAIVHASKNEVGQNITLVQGARRFSDCLFFDEFQALRGPRFEYRPVLSGTAPLSGAGEWNGRSGRVQNHLENLASPLGSYCVCGSRPMVDEVKRLLVLAGAREEFVFCEGY